MHKSVRDVLVAYFSKMLPTLEQTYSWRIEDISGFNRSGESGYTANIELKNFFGRQWMRSEDHFEVAEKIVKGWGQVKNNKPETLKQYTREILSNSPQLKFSGVASYSKIYAIVQPEVYAIFDARVAACLNSIQLSNDKSLGSAFPYPPGRNKITGNSETGQGFSYIYPTKKLVQNGWVKIEKKHAYKQYLDLLHDCLPIFPDYKLHDLEMVLFSNAETECKKHLV